uniref:Uncharacterized protein n=1 Tax=Arundo donax TaxID=35708 RepID=A0A0A8XNN6_ARUDO
MPAKGESVRTHVVLLIVYFFQVLVYSYSC